MTDITDVRDALIAGTVAVDEWEGDWTKKFFGPELKAMARQLVSRVPPEILDQFAFEQPEAWEELQGQLEV